jgi:NADP-dependent 3-hydroxy acid dehydrogenase YdfG
MRQSGANLFRLDGRVALVTGASSGLGARIATVLRQAGADVVLTARRQGRLDAVAAGQGEQATVTAGDLRDPAVRAALIDRVSEQYGRLDVLINNAGV